MEAECLSMSRLTSDCLVSFVWEEGSLLALQQASPGAFGAENVVRRLNIFCSCSPCPWPLLSLLRGLCRPEYPSSAPPWHGPGALTFQGVPPRAAVTVDCLSMLVTFDRQTSVVMY